MIVALPIRTVTQWRLDLYLTTPANSRALRVGYCEMRGSYQDALRVAGVLSDADHEVVICPRGDEAAL